MGFIGKAPINWFLFVTGKLAAFILGFSILFQMFFLNFRFWQVPVIVSAISVYVFFFAIILLVVAMLNIGESLHVGLPEGNTTLKTGGLYRFSRNPIYVAVYLISLSAMAYTFNPIGIFLGLYCIVIHHMIVLSEEEFLKKRFGKDYIEYCGKVRRYI